MNCLHGIESERIEGANRMEEIWGKQKLQSSTIW